MAAVLRVIILTEDSGGQGHDVLAAVAKKLFTYLVPGFQTQPAVVQMVRPDDGVRDLIRANAWEGRKNHHRRVDLVKKLATDLVEGDLPRLVLWHVDGDTAWSQRRTASRVANWQTQIEAPVRAQLLRHFGDEVKVGQLMERLILVVPYYSIESWLYQNLDECERIAVDFPGDRSALKRQLQAWRSDRAALDEVTQLKDRCRLGDEFNKPLAEKGWPIREVVAVGASFAALVEALQGRPHLLTVLQRAREG